MEDSRYIKEARHLLEQAKNQQFSAEQRREAAIELAGLMLEEARSGETYQEKHQQRQLARMMNDPQGKAFTTSMTDQCFRSKNTRRIADQLLFLLHKFGIPAFLNPYKQAQLALFRWFGRPLAPISIPFVKRLLRKEMSKVILPAAPKSLAKHMIQRKRNGVRMNLNHLGEAILGEEEAERRLNIYLEDLANPDVEYISVKASTLFSQISLLGWEETLDILGNRLKLLYRTAQKHTYILPSGKKVSKFVNLDMEEYRDLYLTVELFRRTLDDAEFYQCSAGIVLQAYLPDAFLLQQELTAWAVKRVNNGGAPIKIRLVKGANLAMEQIEAALKGWPQAPYPCKLDVDANYKRMINYACEFERARAVRIGIGSHNLLDIAYALLLRAEKGIEKYVSFEMLEGMADNMRRVVQKLAGNMLLYCPVADDHEFQNAIAYLMRRLDENTAPENFLRHTFDMLPGTAEWRNQTDLFSLACHQVNDISYAPRRQQSRFQPPSPVSFMNPFENEADTDWSLPQNIKWAETIFRSWSNRIFDPIPIVVGGKEWFSDLKSAIKMDPSNPKKELYKYTLGDETELENLLQTAQRAAQEWARQSLKSRLLLVDQAAYQLRSHRGDLIGAMVADTAKTIIEADVEVSEAIDFAAYYSRMAEEWHLMEDISWKPKGVVLVAPPWNFPCSIPAGGILAALAAGNAVIFKPAPEAVLVGWELVQTIWKAGISRDVLQFFCCPDDPIGTKLIQDPRVDAVILTGATSTAKRFLQLRPDLDLIAETGGKNALIITNMSDRDLAIKDLIHSAFGHAGQKCSACSLAILEKEVYDDPHFRQQLRDAAASLRVNTPWNPSTKVNPLIRQPSPELLKGLTTLEDEETWLLKPEQDQQNPQLWSPGIKLGVKPGSFTHQTELFGPVLGVMRADSLQQAIEWANGTPYGLTSGIHTLDEREQQVWIDQIIAGNCYINRTITGAIVRRQPFGGCKDSSFGQGAKAGGPNYLIQLMYPVAVKLPREKEPFPEMARLLNQKVQKGRWSQAELETWISAIGSYAFYWNHYFSKSHDPSRIQGQHNFLKYVPQQDLVLRVQEKTSLLDVLKCMIAAHICNCPLEISISPKQAVSLQEFLVSTIRDLKLTQETEDDLISRINGRRVIRLRLLEKPSDRLLEASASHGCHTIVAPVLANGRLELLHFLREVSLSIDYHRYGYVYSGDNSLIS